jgi:heat shock protein HslJ
MIRFITALGLLAFGAVAVAASNAAATTPEQGQDTPSPASQSQGRYSGELELGERTLRYEADFVEDGSFRRREEVTGPDGKRVFSVDAVGRYEISPDGTRLVLIDQERRRHVFDRVSESEWRAFDLEGPTRQAFGRIARVEAGDPVSVEAQLRAVVERDEQGLAVRDCGSGIRFGLDEPGELDRELPEEGLLVAIEGEFVAGDDGSRLQRARVLAEQPGGCDSRDSAAPLGNTYWRLVSVGRETIEVPEGQREPHLRFAPETGRFLGQGLCNRLGGSFETVGEAIRLRQIDRPPHPCPAGSLNDQDVLDALASAKRFRIRNGDLEMVDGRGRVRVRFSPGPAGER